MTAISSPKKRLLHQQPHSTLSLTYETTEENLGDNVSKFSRNNYQMTQQNALENNQLIENLSYYSQKLSIKSFSKTGARPSLVTIIPLVRENASSKEKRIHQYLNSQNIFGINVKETIQLEQAAQLNFSPRLQKAFDYRSQMNVGRNSLFNKRRGMQTELNKKITKQKSCLDEYMQRNNMIDQSQIFYKQQNTQSPPLKIQDKAITLRKSSFNTDIQKKQQQQLKQGDSNATEWMLLDDSSSDEENNLKKQDYFNYSKNKLIEGNITNNRNNTVHDFNNNDDQLKSGI
eukprot:403375932